MKFNINEYVKVKLTDEGREILNKKKQRFKREYNIDLNFHKKEDEDGWSEWQMWDLMMTFGEHIHLGCKPPFETNIEIVVNEEK